MAKFAQTEQFENTPNRNVSIVIQKMIRNSISVCKSIRLHLINPVSQFQSTLDLFFRFLPCPLFLFVAFFLLYRRHLRFICIQEHIIHVHKAVRMCL